MPQDQEYQEPVHWALPVGTAAPDRLKSQIEVYNESIILRMFQDDTTIVRMVAADQVAHALNRETTLSSGILPDNALWWQSSALRTYTALWREPAVWRAALQVAPFRPPRRLDLPMPGLVFICTPGQPPWIYAAKKRPAGIDDHLYHAPTFNTFRSGKTCPGSHRFPHRVQEIPESFFTSFFSMTGDSTGRSQKHPERLIDLWNEIAGAGSFPVEDLVPAGAVSEIMRLQNQQ